MLSMRLLFKEKGGSMKKVRPGHYQETIPFGEGRDLIIKIVEKPRLSVAIAGG